MNASAYLRVRSLGGPEEASEADGGDGLGEAAEARRHNQGPPLEELPDWRVGDLFVGYCWRKAHRAAWKVSRDIALYRLERAERLGLTYEEYALEILERGRNLQPEDAERIEAIKLKRAMRGEA